jgi:hypothetical protein
VRLNDVSNDFGAAILIVTRLMAVSRTLLAGILSVNESGITAFGRALANANVF